MEKRRWTIIDSATLRCSDGRVVTVVSPDQGAIPETELQAMVDGLNDREERLIMLDDLANRYRKE